MRNCIVPGCDRRHKHGIKRTMFLVPKNEEMRKKWVDALPKFRPLKTFDKVCHLHFPVKDVIFTYDHIINGQVYKLDRGRPRLNPQAVPSLCLPTEEEMKLLVKEPRRNTKKSVVRTEDLAECKTLTDMNVESIQEESQPTYEIIVAEQPQTPELELQELQTPAQKAERIEHIFSMFYDEIYEVKLPNLLWGMHRCPERSAIFFSYIDVERQRCSKMIKIAADGMLKVFVVDQPLYGHSILDGVVTIEMLSELLKQIDSMEICEKEA